MNIDKLKEPYVLLLIGPPLVGKSTWIRNNFSNKPVTIISRDQIVMDCQPGRFNSLKTDLGQTDKL